MTQRWLGFSLLCALATACGGGGGGGGTPDAAVDAPVADTTPPPVDTAPPDAGPPPDICDELGLPRRAFDEGATGMLFGDLAGDFTVNEVDDTTWNLKSEWTGCESYVFLTYFPGAYGDFFFDTVLDGLVTGPRNVHYFFVSFEDSPGARRTRMEGVRAGLEETFGYLSLPEEERAAQRERFHFVLDRVIDVPGSVGPFVLDYLTWARTDEALVDLGDRGRARPPAPYAFGIDRDQRWEAGGSVDDATGQPRFQMASYLGDFYNYKAAIADQIANETGTRTALLLDEDVTDRILVREVTLPSAAEMQDIDTLEVDVAVTCPHRTPYACSEWDRIARIELCLDAECTDRREVVRWITPYWRVGTRRWLIDASPLLGLLREGGATTFRIEMGPEWERATLRHARMELRFSTRGAPAAEGTELAFRGGSFGATYNDRAPFSFTPPADATRVEIVTILSGHGQTEGDNCAEWCDHRHVFGVNGTELPAIQSDVGGEIDLFGCGERAKDGLIPGQFGNWAPARAYWCPGLPVHAIRTDITSQVTLGAENTLTYRGTFGTGAPAGGDIDLSAYVVWYR